MLVHVTALDQNFLLNSKGETSILGNVNGRSLRRKSNNNKKKNNRVEEIQLANLAG